MIRWKIQFTPESSRLLSKLHPENKKMIKQAVNDLRKNPYAGKDLQEELFGFKSFRSKQYRIIYKLNETENFLQIYHIGRRSNVYKQFQRLLTELQKP